MDKDQKYTQDENQKESEEPKTPHLSGSDLRNYVLSSLRPDGGISSRSQKTDQPEKLEDKQPQAIEADKTPEPEVSKAPQVPEISRFRAGETRRTKESLGAKKERGPQSAEEERPLVATPPEETPKSYGSTHSGREKNPLLQQTITPNSLMAREIRQALKEIDPSAEKDFSQTASLSADEFRKVTQFSETSSFSKTEFEKAATTETDVDSAVRQPTTFEETLPLELKRGQKAEKKAKKKAEIPQPATEEAKSETVTRVETRQKEDKMVGKIVRIVVLAVIVLALISAFSFYRYVKAGLAPLDEKDTTLVQVEIPSGTSTKGIAEILEKEQIIKSAFVFNYYMKVNSYSDFKAGYYQMSPSMTLDEIAADLEAGGTDEPEALADGQVIIPEGKTVEEIGDLIAKNTGYEKATFLALMQDQTFFDQMVTKYPNLLTSAKEATDVRYHFEGYLFPAKYNYYKEESLEVFVEKMITQTDLIMSNYYENIAKSDELTVHKVLTLASLVEREGVTDADRRKIAQVFFNRLAENMPLQSDIAVLYALNEHKEQLTIADTEVDSPYNLYVHTGYGPGPFDNPGENSIDAVMNPELNDYLYFVADVTTGKVYFAKTYDEHLVNKEKYVDNKE